MIYKENIRAYRCVQIIYMKNRWLKVPLITDSILKLSNYIVDI